LLRDLVERLRQRQFLSENLVSGKSDNQIVETLLAKGNADSPRGPLVGSRIMDVTEYGRVVHAEMLAVCDAARLGNSIKGTILYVTTFPCHNCTKHILASGIKRVV
jgi:deoxycytidylate deaminase